MLGTVLATLLVFFVLSRYRMPAIPALAIFAAAGLVEFADLARARRWGRAVVAALLVLGFWHVTHRDLIREDLSVAYYNLGNRYRELARWDDAIGAYRESLLRNPSYTSAYNNLAIAYERSGAHDAEAIEIWERVRALGEARGLERYVERADRHLRALRGEAAEGEVIDPAVRED